MYFNEGDFQVGEEIADGLELSSELEVDEDGDGLVGAILTLHI